MIHCTLTSLAQYSPTYKQSIELSENFGVVQSDVNVNLTIDTEALILAGKMQATGDDIRFYNGLCLSNGNLDYWIESGINTTSTSIWIRIPQLTMNQIDTINMFYGDATAVSESNFAAVFPNAIVSGGTNINSTGIIDAGWLQIDANDTLFVTAGTPLEIYAQKSIINGVVFAVGAGYQAPPVGVANGNGPGGGTGGSSSGAGGGSYGGIGGAGGFDSGDPINTAGPTYGTNNLLDIDMGSTGGSVSTILAGSGGGAFSLVSKSINITGLINCNGSDAQMPGAGQGAGGGSGGGVLLRGDIITFNGLISVDGADGSVGTSTANDDGGGGGGGRIKIYHDALFDNFGSLSASFGIGGPNGNAAPGINGQAGTIFDTVVAYQDPVIVNYLVESAVTSNLTPDLASLPMETYSCSGTPSFIPIALNSCGDTIQGTADLTFPLTTLGVNTITWTFDDGISTPITQMQDITISGPNVSVVQSGETLTAQSVSGTYQWVDCDNNYAFISGETNASFTATVNGNYAVIVMDNCQDTSACYSIQSAGVDDVKLNDFTIYPNPNNGVFTLNLESTSADRIEIQDLQGRLVKSHICDSKEALIDISSEKNGIYIVQLFKGELIIGVKRIMKN